MQNIMNYSNFLASSKDISLPLSDTNHKGWIHFMHCKLVFLSKINREIGFLQAGQYGSLFLSQRTPNLGNNSEIYCLCKF